MRRRFTRFLLYVLSLATLVGVGGLLWHLREQRILFYTDADSIRRPVDEATTRDVLWTPPVAVDGAVNSPRSEFEPRVTHDGLVMYLVRHKDDGDGDIFTSTRTTSGWTEPEPFEAINSAADEVGPEPSRDGRAVYFASNRIGGAGGFDLWVIRRDDDAESGWGEPENLGPGVNTLYHEYGPTVTENADTIWFASNRPAEGDAALPGADESVIVREDIYDGDFDLYSAAIVDGVAGPALPAHTLNSDGQDGAPALSPAGDFLYFSSDRAGGRGGYDLYRARLAPQILLPANLGAPVNTAADELDPGVSIAGFGLHFSSDRTVALTPDAPAAADTAVDAAEDAGDPPDDTTIEEADRDHDLYFAASREVYTATEVFRATVDWIALLPYVLWIVIALLLMALIYSMGRVLKSERYKTLDLLARCLIASLLIHALLLFGLAFWGVGNSVSEWVANRGTKVAIVSPSVGSDLEAQIRGSVTDVAMDAQVVAVEQTESTVAPPEAERAPTEMTVAQTAIEASEPAPTTPANDAPAPSPDLPESVEPAEVEPVSGMAFDLEIEANPAPTAAAETAVEIPAEMPAPQPLALEAPAARVDPVVSNPEPSDAARAAGGQTVVPDSIARDAQPAARHASAQPAASHRPATFVTDLPAFPEATARDTAEAEPTVVSTATASPRSRRPLEGPQSTTPTARIDVAPVAAAAVAEESSLASIGAITRAPDAPSFPTPRLSEPVPASGTTLALDLPAPAAQSAPSAQESEVAAAVNEMVAPAGRRASPSMTPTSVINTGIVRTRPTNARFAPALTAGSMAAASAARVRDARPAVTHALPPSSVTRRASLSPNQPAIAPATALAFDLPAATADIAPPAVESVVEVDARDVVSPVERRRTRTSRDVASNTAMVLADPGATALDPAMAARLANTSPSNLALDAPPPIDLAPLEVRRLPVAPRRELELEVPLEEIIAPSPQRQRAPEARIKIVEEMGGSAETERAVAMSLDWLARHQSPDGRWDSDGYDDACHACSGATRIEVDVAVTGLSMLCFLATDNTHLKEGPYQDAMARALQWLLSQQGRDGNLLGTESMYSHGIATIALAEAYGMTGDPALEEPVRAAIDFIVSARNRRGGGWRYAPGQAGDTSVLGWQMMALKSAESAGIEIDPAGFATVRRWLDSISRLAPPGLYIYQPGRPHSPAMTAEGLFVQQLLGSDRDRVAMDESIDYLLANIPDWNQEANTYYWYYGTLALFQNQGDPWRRWNEHVREQLLEHQVVTGRAAGSWPPSDQWSRTGGRIYQTAICTLTLEVYYRYLPRFVKTARGE